MIEYEYIERISRVNHVAYIKKLLPLCDEGVDKIYSGRYDYTIHNDFTWNKSSEPLVSGNNLIDLYTYIKAIPEEYSYLSFAEFFQISMKKNDIMPYNNVYSYKQENILTLDDKFIDESINKYKINCDINKKYIYYNIDKTKRGIVVSYKDHSGRLINIIFNQYIKIFNVCLTSNNQSMGYSPHFPQIIDYSKPGDYFNIERSFFTEPYPIYNILDLSRFPENNVIITDNEENCDNLNNTIFKINNVTQYFAVSWPGGEFNTVGKVDWSGLRGRNIVFQVSVNPKSCRLAYETFQSVKAYRPSSFKFLIDTDNTGITSDEALLVYPIIDRKQFVKFAKEYFNLTLEDSKEQEIELICYSAKTFLETKFQEIPDIIPGILPQPGIMEVFSDRGVGKSWFCLELAKAFSEGSYPFQKSDWMVSQPKNVFYIDGEFINSKMQERMRLLNIKDNTNNSDDNKDNNSSSNNGKFIICPNIAQDKNIDLLDKNFQKLIHD
ncbi:MAG: AAA family ATPase [Deltaproteobacteria bacterium]|jgi:hypothetical protein|nr:AAA family ATPase [Deltaproteobacteria bacterium]